MKWDLARVFPWRLVFTSDGVGVVIRSVELNDQVKTRSSESQVEELGKSQSVGTYIVNGYPSPSASDYDSMVFTWS